MRNEIRSAIVVFAAIGVAIAVVSVYFNSLQTENSRTFEPAIVNESGKLEIDKSKFMLAPELRGVGRYINTEPVTMEDLRGKVVLVDFWTYTCINCIRTVPYLNAWHDKYADDGLVILGLHAPEFEFEKDYQNVKQAVEKFEIEYPVVQDNEMETWRAYKNNYWPHKYLVDHEGYIRYDHIGEGAYEETEMVIQQLLKERSFDLGIEIDVDEDAVAPDEAVDVDFRKIRTPELYLGYAFGASLGNEERLIPNGVVEFTLPEEIDDNKVYLEGTWKSNRDHMELVSESGKVVLRYNAKAVNIVAAGDSTLSIKIDDETIGTSMEGSDVSNGTVQVDEERLYSLVFDDQYSDHVIEISVQGKDYRLYTFTFG